MNSPSNSSSPFLILFTSLIIASFPLSSAQPSFWFYECGKTGNYTSDSTFAANLNTFLSSITSGTELVGGDAHFYNQTMGNKSRDDFVTGEVYCRCDLSPSDCHSCYTDAAGKIRELCPNQKEAIGWYRDCAIRYSNRPIFGTVVSSPKFAVANPGNASDPVGFDRQLTLLLRDLQSKASAGYPLKWASGSRRVSGSQSVYAVLQCTPDLNASACSRCAEVIINHIPRCCYGKTGGVILIPNCASRFDVYLFYHSGDVSLPSPARITKDHVWRRKSLQLPIFIVAPIFVVTLLALGSSICHRQRKAKKTIKKEIEDIIVAESLQFDLATIKAATRNFSLDNMLGEGGFGEVYKGKLGSGQEIAVKRLSRSSTQGISEFKNELVLVAKLQHKNLVKLLGFCMAVKEMILVYEFLPNSSLNRFLFDPIKSTSLDWKIRFNIIIGIARGLLYLHEDSRLKVIHRDLKSSNILLDEAMNPKIADFGLAKLFGVDQTQGDTKRIVGTYGYMAPEYAMTGHFSVKSDVFSFGVTVLEVVSGQRSSYFGRPLEEALLHRAWRLWNEGKMLDLVDPSLENKYEFEEVIKCIHIGLLCVQEDPSKRPRMTTIVAALNGDSVRLMAPTSAQFLSNATTLGDEIEASATYSLTCITELHTR